MQCSRVLAIVLATSLTPCHAQRAGGEGAEAGAGDAAVTGAASAAFGASAPAAPAMVEPPPAVRTYGGALEAELPINAGRAGPRVPYTDPFGGAGRGVNPTLSPAPEGIEQDAIGKGTGAREYGESGFGDPEGR